MDPLIYISNHRIACFFSFVAITFSIAKNNNHQHNNHWSGGTNVALANLQLSTNYIQRIITASADGVEFSPYWRETGFTNVEGLKSVLAKTCEDLTTIGQSLIPDLQVTLSLGEVVPVSSAVEKITQVLKYLTAATVFVDDETIVNTVDNLYESIIGANSPESSVNE